MVASGRASVFILRKKSQTIVKVFLCFLFRCQKIAIPPQQKINVVMQTWDHAVGMICVHEAGGKVCYVTLFEKPFKLYFSPFIILTCLLAFLLMILRDVKLESVNEPSFLQDWFLLKMPELLL